MEGSSSSEHFRKGATLLFGTLFHSNLKATSKLQTIKYYVFVNEV